MHNDAWKLPCSKSILGPLDPNASQQSTMHQDRRLATALFPAFRPITVLEDKIMVGWSVKLDKTRSVIGWKASNNPAAIRNSPQHCQIWYQEVLCCFRSHGQTDLVTRGVLVYVKYRLLLTCLCYTRLRMTRPILKPRQSTTVHRTFILILECFLTVYIK